MDDATKKPDANASSEVDPKQAIKLAIDLAPLVIFFAVYLTAGLYWATGVLMVTTVAAMIASKVLLGHISTSVLITTGLVVGFGALTFWFNDTRFIKVKPTMAYALFAAALLGGLLFKRSLLQLLLGEAFQLTETGWRSLSLRFGLFFLSLAALNEIIWRNFSETTWATFKVFGFIPLTMLFVASQIGFIQRHQKNADGSH